MRITGMFRGIADVHIGGHGHQDPRMVTFGGWENSMNKVHKVCVTVALITVFAMLARAQKTTAEQKASTSPKTAAVERSRPLVLTESIPLPGVKGRFDHFASGGGRLFISELGNNSIAVINTGGRTLDHTIADMPDPQGEAFFSRSQQDFFSQRSGQSPHLRR